MMVLAAFLLATDFALNKLYQKLYSAAPEKSLLFNCLLGLITALFFFVLNKFTLHITTYSLIIAGLSGSLVMAYNIIGFRLMKMGTMSVYTVFLMAGGMLLPYGFGLIFLNERFEITKALGTALILFGVILSGYQIERDKKTNAKQIGLCLAVFIINGIISVLSKLHQSGTVYPKVTSIEFVILSGMIKFVLSGLLLLIYYKKSHIPKESPKQANLRCAIPIICGSALAGGTSYMLQLLGAESLPASMMYPFITGGSIIFSAIAGAVIYKEKLMSKTIVSIAVCFLGTLLFL